MRGAFFILALTGIAQAGTVRVEGSSCAEHVHIRAQGAPLGEVLRQMSKALGFRLVAKTELDQPVDLDQSDSPEALLKALGQGQNFIVQTAPSAACKGRQVVSDVWVLPVGDAVARATPKPLAVQCRHPGPDASPRKDGTSGRTHDPRGARGHAHSKGIDPECPTP